MRAVWIALGGNAAFLIVALFLGRKLIAHWLDKDVAQFKHDLATASALHLEQIKSSLELATRTEIERLKGELALAAATHSILLSRLQDRRAEVIGALYVQLASAIRLLGSLVRPMQFVGEEPLLEKANKAREALIAAEEGFDGTRVWLTRECAARVDNLVEELRSAYNKFTVYLPFADHPTLDAAQKEKRKDWMSAWKEVTETRVPAARTALETEMRSLISPSGVSG